MAVSPPFAISETLPADSDLISIFPSQEHPFRDTVESWLTFLSDPTTGLLKSTAFAFPFVITNTGAGTFMQFVSTDAGAAAAPQIDLFRNSASPAVSDILGGLLFTGKNSAAATKSYAQISVTATNVTSTTEAATINLDVSVAGTVATRLAVTTAGISVTGTTTTAVDFISSTTTAQLSTTGAGTINLRPNGAASATGQMSIASSGNVTVAGTLAATGAVSSSAGISGTTGTFSGAVSGTTITGSGAVQGTNLVTTANIIANSAAATMNFRPSGPASTTGQMTLTASGTLTAAGDITASSDRRLKKSISPLGLQWAAEMVREVQPVTFLRKTSEERGIGFIAQDVEAYAPELVRKDPRGYLSLAYPNMVAVLWKVVQDLQERVTQLEAR